METIEKVYTTRTSSILIDIGSLSLDRKYKRLITRLHRDRHPRVCRIYFPWRMIEHEGRYRKNYNFVLKYINKLFAEPGQRGAISEFGYL